MIARAVLVLLAVGLLWAVVAFAALAVFYLLGPAVGDAAAAALTAGILALLLSAGVLVYMALPQANHPTPLASLAPASAKLPDQGVPVMLATLAKDYPLLAVGCATLLGVADSIQAENHRARRD